MKKCRLKYLVIVLIMLVVIISYCLISEIYSKKTDELMRVEETDDYYNELNDRASSFIDDEEIAVLYGEILLKKAFPLYFKYTKNIKLEAIELDSSSWGEDWGIVWKVYTANEGKKWTLFHGMVYYFGGDKFVLFKKNGELICFDVGM